MIPVGPLFNHPHTYKPFSSRVRSPDVSLRTRPLSFGTTPAKDGHEIITPFAFSYACIWGHKNSHVIEFRLFWENFQGTSVSGTQNIQMN